MFDRDIRERKIQALVLTVIVEYQKPRAAKDRVELADRIARRIREAFEGLRALVVIFLLASCGDTVAPPIVEEDPIEPIEISLAFEYSCRYLGLTPRHTFRVDVDPDTIEVAYELVVNDVVDAFRDAIGTFVDTLYVDWGSEQEYRVEYVFAYKGWRVEGVTRCRVQ